MSKHIRLAALLGCFLVGSTLRADHSPSDEAGPLPGHSAHGDTFDEGPRRGAELMAGTGKVSFPITVRGSDAQRFFNQGIGQLHGFWYLEAERSFRQVAALDSDCPMAYWGMAMANITNDKRAKGFIAEAAKRAAGAKLAPRESGWIEALAGLYKDEPKQEGVRKKNFLSAMKAMMEKFPEDVEIKALWVRYTWEYRDVKECKIADYDAVNKVLDQIFVVAPQHPAHHFRIHLWDDKNASKAIESAAKNGPAAPGVAHMWHMPGHTYSKLDRFIDAAWQQEAAARVDHAYMIRDAVMPYEIHNYAHNNEWLVRDLTYVGRVGDALDLARNMIELPRHPKYNAESNRGSGAEYGRARLIDVLAQHEMWDQYLALCDSVYLAEDGDADQQLQKIRYQGVASAATGKTGQAKKYIAQLEELKKKEAVATTRPANPPTTRPVAQATTRPAAAPTTQQLAQATTRPTTMPAVASAPKPSGRAVAIDRAIAHINGQIALSAGDAKSAVDLFLKADVRKEHLSQAYLAAGNRAKAEEAAKSAVDGNKGKTYPLANQVIVLHAIGREIEAVQAMDNLRELSEGIDRSVPIYARLEPIAREMELPSDWRRARILPPDLGERPRLDTLGPFRWRPSAAPDFSAVSADKSVLSLAGYRGKPVVVVFYLGYSCLHCTRQLHAFAPMTKEFAAAGISLLAISTDTPENLHKAWEGAKLEGEAFPFPLASDASLGIFKQYHCYDDFEKAPLHGTFLLDGQGLVRWRDIGPEPFMDTKFLLKECQRLLAQPLSVAQGR